MILSSIPKLLITAIENTRFEIYLRFILIQTDRIFLLLTEVISLLNTKL